ncbi:MAG: dihydroorotate dehydrogenase [Spirochaetes bacterium]|nr:dihydroorotate dehydrogenase [Spirochaetota bacterium]
MEDISFGKLKFKRNGILASGILGTTGWSMAKVASAGAGGITCKSISLNFRHGHPTPVVQAYEHGILNAVGLSSSGIDHSNHELTIVRKNSDAIIIASVFGGTPKEFAQTVEKLDHTIIDAIELNISCPNVADEFGLPFSATPESAVSVIKIVRPVTQKPLIIKLSPNFPKLGLIAKACEEAGANGITAINTVGPGMLIDIDTFQPKLSNKRGGVSGPAILPIAIRCVHDIYKNVTIPIIGMGGITHTEDAIQMIAAGATLYGVGSGILYNGLEIFTEINQGITDFLAKKGLTYQELIGISHREG